MLTDGKPGEKPTLTVDLGGSQPAALAALSYLSALKSGASLHDRHDRRHPLGIYNVSTGRICNKIKKCAERLEKYWLLPPYISELDKQTVLRNEIIDYLELCLYAAAEHVDDIESIAACFFATSQELAKAPTAKALKRAVKPLRDQIASFTNTIKHAQGRIRLFAVEFRHNDRDTCLHGFFVEGVDKGAISPCPILHNTGSMIISITSFLWGIVIYLGAISSEVGTFLKAVSAVDEKLVTQLGSPPFRDAVIALARLPLYSFDDEHPFTRVQLAIHAGDGVQAALRSNIYGSLSDRWSKSDQGRVGAARLLYEGDGVSRTFRMVQPKHVRLQHWD